MEVKQSFWKKIKSIWQALFNTGRLQSNSGLTRRQRFWIAFRENMDDIFGQQQDEHSNTANEGIMRGFHSPKRNFALLFLVVYLIWFCAELFAPPWWPFIVREKIGDLFGLLGFW